VRIDSKWGYIDSTGNFVIAMCFAGAGPFSEGLAAVRLVTPTGPSQVGFIDKHGELVIGTSFDDAHRFCEGMAAVQSGQIWGFVDREGRIVIQPRFTFAGSFSGGLASVSIEEAHGLRRDAYIDRPGKIVWLAPHAYAYHPIDR
jgi:WG repeat protein